MTRSLPHSPNRRQAMVTGVTALLAAASGCHQQQAEQSAEPSSRGPKVPLRLVMMGSEEDAAVINRAWGAVAEHPLDITTITLDRQRASDTVGNLLDAVSASDVVILPLAAMPAAVETEAIVPLGGSDYQAAMDALGDLLTAARNGTSRFAGETYSLPLGTSQPFLITSEEAEPVTSWEDYDQRVEDWGGLAGEPTAPGWAAAMFLWRAAGERNWLFDRDDLSPLLRSDAYVGALEQMVTTCNRYQERDLTPQVIWDRVAAGDWKGGVAFPEVRSQSAEVVSIQSLPGTTSGTRVLFDPFSPMICLPASCRQSAASKQFMLWLSGGEGSQAVRRQLSGMTDARPVDAKAVGNDSVTGGGLTSYDAALSARLANPVTMPTLQLLSGASYYQTLDEQVRSALQGETAPREALEQVSGQWEQLTNDIGVEKQRRIWRRAQGMRG